MASNSLLPLSIAMVCAALSGCERQVSFSADVKPILDNYCISCHSGSGEGQAVSGFAVDDYESVMHGTKYGKVVVPGSPMSSSLYLLITGKADKKIHMPPHHDESLAEGRGFALSRTHIETITNWIEQGAKDN